MVALHVVWLKFLICGIIIFFAGRALARYADIIAEKTGLGGLWVGLILVAFATSLPELFTGIGSIVFMNAPNLTVGNIFGANSYNLLNIGLLDLLAKGGPILGAIGSGQLLTAVLSLVPLMLAAAGIILKNAGFHPFSVANVGIFSIAIFVSYCVITKVIYNFEKRTSLRGQLVPGGDDSARSNLNEIASSPSAPRNDKYGAEVSLKKVYMRYAIAAFAIMASGIWLAYIGKELSVILRLEESFVGSLLLGFATTLPEITVSIAALAIGAREIAVANMLGSNLFNTTIIFVDDIFYRKGPILEAVSADQILQASVVMAMTAVIIVAMIMKPRRKFFNVSWYVPVIFVIFLAGAYLNWRCR